MLIEYAPHLVLEGMLIGRVRHRLPPRVHLHPRRVQARLRDLLRRSRGSARRPDTSAATCSAAGYDLEVTVHRGAGAYICGEETGLLNSLEGKRGEPRLKPPFPAIEGLYGMPTVVNNVETLAYLVPILERGAGVVRRGRYRAQQRVQDRLGVGPRAETRQLRDSARARRCARSSRLAGGLAPGPHVRWRCSPAAVRRPASSKSTSTWPYDYESMAKAGSMLGSGAFVVFDDTTDFVKAAHNLVRFFAHESCGQCTPCREGGKLAGARARASGARPRRCGRLRHAERVAGSITGLNLCALGDSIEPFLKSVLAALPRSSSKSRRRGGMRTVPV